jgi:serine/threonine protein kinase
VQVWLLMEFLNGGTLERASKTSNLKENAISYIARECLQGVAYLHSIGLVHRVNFSDFCLLC